MQLCVNIGLMFCCRKREDEAGEQRHFFFSYVLMTTGAAFSPIVSQRGAHTCAPLIAICLTADLRRKKAHTSPSSIYAEHLTRLKLSLINTVILEDSVVNHESSSDAENVASPTYAHIYRV